MIEYKDNKVKLNVDLTKYHPSLVEGIEGVTCGKSCWGVNVRFSDGHIQDVLFDSLIDLDALPGDPTSEQIEMYDKNTKRLKSEAYERLTKKERDRVYRFFGRK